MKLDPTPFPGGFVLYCVLVLGAVVLFAHTIWGRLGLLLKARPDHRFNRWGARVKQLLTYAIGQKRTIGGDPLSGIMHAFIFWGFLAVAINTIHHVGGGFVTGFALPFFSPGSPLGSVYIPVRDVFEILVLIMVVLAVYRRAVVRPDRITQSAEAYLILGLIGILMIADFVMSGTEAAFGPLKHSWSPIQSALCGVFAGMDAGGLKATFITAWWIHIITLFVFLNLLPLGKHFHIITSLPNVFFARLEDEGPVGTPKPLDLEDEAAESFGVSRIEEFTWKQYLDLFSCTECGRCQEFCPAHLTEKPLSPKRIITDYRDHLYAKQPYILSKMGDKQWPGPALTSEEVVSEDVIWSCTTCHWCEEACPLFIEHLDKLVEQRRYQVLMESSFPPELIPVFKGLENNSNPWGIGAASRQDWAQDLEIPLLAENQRVEYLYYVGCAGAFDERNKKVCRSFAKLLQRAGVSFAILGTEEGCCGDQARRLGNEYLFQMMAKANIEQFEGYGVKKILTTCPHGYNVFKNEYPQFGGDFSVYHHSEFIQKLIEGGKFRFRKPLGEKVVYHDSCYLGRYNRIYHPPRQILSSIPGLELVEPILHHHRGLCCGAGGGRMWLEEKIGSRINQMRVDQLAETNAGIVSLACPFCMTMISDGIKETDREGQMDVKDIAELVYESLETS
ncbi:(Fe-S)-binding protein [candidate division KSB1 bacterium]|nr:(Fe-S)-binding protein [candidate division KSB1 bacterium]